MSIKYCSKCLFPNTKPDLYFNADDVCDACTSAEMKHNKFKDNNKKSIDWEKRLDDLHKIINEKKIHNKGAYDCVIPVSGGKDSTWQVYVAKNILHLNPLAVTFDQFDQTETGLHNLNILKEIGVDHFHITLNPLVIKKLVRKGLELIGDPYWVNHVGIFSIPINIASKFGIPIVIYGENPQFEYGGPEQNRLQMIMDKRWRQEFAGMRGLREEDMIDSEIKEKDLALLKYPKDEEIIENNVTSVFLGYFMKWDPIKHTKFVKKLGWKSLNEPSAGSWSNFENCDMKYIDIRERIKYLKFGKMNRKDALELVKQIDGNVSADNMREFASYLEISEQKLKSIINSFVNTEIFKKDDKGNFIEIIDRY